MDVIFGHTLSLRLTAQPLVHHRQEGPVDRWRHLPLPLRRREAHTGMPKHGASVLRDCGEAGEGTREVEGTWGKKGRERRRGRGGSVRRRHEKAIACTGQSAHEGTSICQKDEQRGRKEGWE